MRRGWADRDARVEMTLQGERAQVSARAINLHPSELRPAWKDK
jgi:hypothetical protein